MQPVQVASTAKQKNDEVDYVDYDVSISETDASSIPVVSASVGTQAGRAFPAFGNRTAACFAVYLEATRSANSTLGFEVVNWRCL